MSKTEEESDENQSRLDLWPKTLTANPAPGKLSSPKEKDLREKLGLALWQEIMWNVPESTIHETLENNKPVDLANDKEFKNFVPQWVRDLNSL